MCSVGLRSGLCAGHLGSSSPVLVNCVFSLLLRGVAMLEQVRAPVKGKCNAIAYEAILLNCVVPVLWKQSGESLMYGCDDYVPTNY